MVQNRPTSPGADDTPWSTPAATWHSPVVSPSPAGGGTPETPDHIVSPNVADGTAYGDDVASSAGAAVLAAQARYHAHQKDTYGQGSTIGVAMDLPEVPTAHSKHVGGDDAGYPS
jgi:hypothetical protein